MLREYVHYKKRGYPSQEDLRVKKKEASMPRKRICTYTAEERRFKSRRDSR